MVSDGEMLSGTAIFYGVFSVPMFQVAILSADEALVAGSLAWHDPGPNITHHILE
jgi:hypothetical protein